MPWQARDVRSRLLRQRASRPQLKRDPLGGDLPHSRMTTLKRIRRMSDRLGLPADLKRHVVSDSGRPTIPATDTIRGVLGLLDPPLRAVGATAHAGT